MAVGKCTEGYMTNPKNKKECIIDPKYVKKHRAKGEAAHKEHTRISLGKIEEKQMFGASPSEISKMKKEYKKRKKARKPKKWWNIFN